MGLSQTEKLQVTSEKKIVQIMLNHWLPLQEISISLPVSERINGGIQAHQANWKRQEYQVRLYSRTKQSKSTLFVSEPRIQWQYGKYRLRLAS